MDRFRKACYQTLVWLFASLFLCTMNLNGQTGLMPFGTFQAEQPESGEFPCHEHTLDEAVHQQMGKNSKRHHEAVLGFAGTMLATVSVAESIGTVAPMVMGPHRLYIRHCIFLI